MMDNKKLKLDVLISCMNEKDFSIINRSNIQSDAIIVNQCDEDKVVEMTFFNKKGEECHAKMVYTRERGLSRSRNMAINNSQSDISLICDDDEILDDDYPEKILQGFQNNPEFDIIAFNLKNPEYTYPQKEEIISYWGTGKLASWQISFRKNEKTSTPFNIKMGSGTGNGGGEENKFLLECMAKGAKIKYLPTMIGEVAQTESRWFHGFDKQYWINRGWIAKMLYGRIKSVAYILGQVILRVHTVDKKNSPLVILCWMIKGWFEKK